MAGAAKQIAIAVTATLLGAFLIWLVGSITPEPFIHLLGGYTKADVEKKVTAPTGQPTSPVASAPSAASRSFSVMIVNKESMK